MAAGSSSGEESAAGTSPEPAQQEQAASPMEAMLAMILQKVGGIQEAVDQVSARTLALEGAMADASLSDSGGPPNGSGSMSATPMGAASVERLERAPDQGPSRDGASHTEDSDSDATMASDARATATGGGVMAAEQNASAGSGGAAAVADGTAGSSPMAPSGTVVDVPEYREEASADRFLGGGTLRKHRSSPVASVSSCGDGDQAAELDSAAAAAAAAAAAESARSARAQWLQREQQAQVEADSQSADGMGQARSGDTSSEPGPKPVTSPSQDGSLPADVPSGSAEEEHSGSDEPLSRGLESLGGGPPPQTTTRDYELGRIGNELRPRW